MEQSIFCDVLLCTDLSPASEHLLSCVSELQKAGTKKVILLHVIYATTPGFDDMLRTEAQPELLRQKKALEDKGFEVVVETPLGVPAQTIENIAEAYCVSCVIIGTHGKGVLTSGLLGSVSSKFLHLSKFPTLLFPNRLTEQACCVPVCRDLFRHIVFPTDFSHTSARAADYLKTLVACTKSRVTLLHVLDVDHNENEAESKRVIETFDHSMLVQLRDEVVANGGIEASIVINAGEAPTTIVQSTKSVGASLLLMGSQGKGFLKEAFLGSVAKQVARSAAIPILFVPAHREMAQKTRAA